MNIQMFNLPLRLTREEVYPFLNLGSAPGSLPIGIDNLIGAYLRRVAQLAKPQGIIRVCSIRSAVPDRVELEDASLAITGPRATAHFIDCSRVTLLAATLGSGIDEHLGELQQTAGAADAFIFNGIAAAAAEHTTEILDAIAVRDIRRNAYYPTARFSPGYGDWPLSNQRQFVESVNAAGIGLTVTPHHLLQPVKSVTAVIGWSRIPVERSYDTAGQAAEVDGNWDGAPHERGPGQPQGKPCRGILTCRDCPLREKCLIKTN